MHEAAATRKLDHARDYRAARQTIGMGHDDTARAAIRALVDERFGGHITRAARAFGVAQPSLSIYLAGRTRLGAKLSRGVARIAPELGPVLLGTAPERTTERAERYPHRAAAIAALVDAGECSLAEAEAAAPVALEADGDLPLLEWVELIRRERRRARRGERGRPITDTDL